ncbi:MAG: phosphate/phosphite/phosphonate ABC transporter substrate-binding protein [Myxococcaceae bacterium]
MTFGLRPLGCGLALAAALTLVSGCKKPDARPGIDRPLVLVFSPAHAPKNPEKLKAALERASGLRVELKAVATGEAAIDLVQAGKADSGLVPLFDYLFCADVFGVQPLVQVLRHGDRSSYAAELFTRADSELREVKGLGGKSVGFVDRYSVTGFLLPAKLLKDQGVEPEPSWLGSHDAVLEAVRSGKVAAGASYLGHSDADPGLRLLARTPEVANEPVFVRPQLPLETQASLKKAFLALGDDPEAMAGLADVTGFRESPAGTYEAALATVNAAGLAVENMVPGGFIRANEHRRPLWSYAP